MQIEYPVGNHMIGHNMLLIEHLPVNDKIHHAIVRIEDLQISMIYMLILKWIPVAELIVTFWIAPLYRRLNHLFSDRLIHLAKKNFNLFT